MNKPLIEPTNIPTLTRPYVHYSNEMLGGELNQYVEGLTGNPNFPGMTQQVVDYTASVGNFRTLQAKAAASRDKDAIIARNNARKQVILDTIAISNTVTELADGDLAALASTNLPIKKTKTPINPEGPAAFTVTASEFGGQLEVKMKGIKGRIIIEARYTLAPRDEKAEWSRMSSRTAKFNIAGLLGGARYFVQLGITGKNNITIWGEIVLSPYVNSSEM